MLIINADDWGGWKKATDVATTCFNAERITSVSAMVFMQDSARAAALGNELGIDAGLHVNFTQSFSDPKCPPTLRRQQDRIRRFLKCHKYALLLYNPFLRGAFRLVYQAQAEEFRRLYGRPPSHIDGHQHMHLCTNMLVDKVIPSGEKVRRSFSFWPGEKSGLNRAYRKRVDHFLVSRYVTTDSFFSLTQCLQNNRLSRVVELSRIDNVELMTHPEISPEQDFLLSDECHNAFRGLQKTEYRNLKSRSLQAAGR